MNNPGPIALRAVEDALLVVGTHEKGNTNSGKEVNQYLASVGLNPGNPWCLAFVIFRLKRAASELAAHLPVGMPLNTGYTPDMANWAQSNHLWLPATGHDAKRGDLAFFWIHAENRIGHVGFVTDRWSGGVITVEGNTSPSPGVTPNGGGVYVKQHTWANLGEGGGFMRISV